MAKQLCRKKKGNKTKTCKDVPGLARVSKNGKKLYYKTSKTNWKVYSNNNGTVLLGKKGDNALRYASKKAKKDLDMNYSWSN